MKKVVIDVISLEEAYQAITESGSPDMIEQIKDYENFVKKASSNKNWNQWYELACEIPDDVFQDLSANGDLIFCEDNETYYLKSAHEKVFGA